MSREKFEAWYLENWGHTEDNHESLFERYQSGCGDEYYRLGVRMAHEAWQAASKASAQQLAAVVAENAGLKSNLMFWDADNPELPYEHPDEIAMECEIAYDDTFEVQVAARMPNRKYRVVIMTDDDCQTEQVVSEEIQTPATDAYLAEVLAIAISEYADKRGFSFQHGSIYAHFGNGDVLVGATKFETGHAGICFAPVRDKTGGSGTEYAWTEGKNTEEVGAVFVISSSSVEGLEVIQGKIAEAIAQLRQGAAL